MSTSLYAKLTEIINTQQKIIFSLVYQLSSIYANSTHPKLTDIADLNYQKLTVDTLSIVVKRELLDYRQLLEEHYKATGKAIKPIKRHVGKKTVDCSINCPNCQAPSSYLYLNNGIVTDNQYKCKICDTLFSHKNRFQKEINLKCPYCNDNLIKTKQRKGFSVYKCKKPTCPYYQKRLNGLSKKERNLFNKNKSLFEMHYHYRDFDLTLSEIESTPDYQPVIQLKNIHCSPRVLGLIMTYHINYGMSAEKTAALMYDVHQIKISAQSIRKYARSVADLVQPMTQHYPYELSNQFCGDETYIRVQGKWNYIYTFFDAEKKIILSHRYSPHRDAQTAVKAIYDVISRFDTLPKPLKLIVDGNPIYKLAEAFYAQNGINFDIVQVIGLSNKDAVSKEYRPLKQIIERLNRTFKANYKPLGSFHSEAGPIAHVLYLRLFLTF